MEAPANSMRPIVGHWFQDRLGRTFQVLTVYWDQILISYRNGRVKVVDHARWRELISN